MQSTEPTTFYDEHPFDWAPAELPAESDSSAPRLLGELIRSLAVGSLVLDIGCGPGRVLRMLQRRGLRCIGLDRSRVSVRMAVERCQRPGVVGDNLRLPFADGAVDAVISDGVIHHTDDPRAAFEENCRVLKPGGQMYLAVYKPSGRYPLLYKYAGEIIRRGLSHAITRPLLVLLAQVPYFLVHFVRSKGKRTWAGAHNLFYDYFVSPRVAFLPRRVVEHWCSEQGAQVLRYDENRGLNVHSFVVRKSPDLNTTMEARLTPGAEVLAGQKRENS
jgi:SAM-dependent methyltransferase